MASPPKYKSIADLIQFYINKYYLKREEIPGLKHSQKEHLNEIEKVSKQYQKQLSKTEWDNEENREQFKKEIDFLTKVFTKQRQEEERKKALQEFKNSLKRRPITSI
jgi:hypothetical protein